MSINRKIGDKIPRPKTSTILSEYIDSISQPTTNDGMNTFITTEVEPISHIPSSHLSEIEINLTTNEVDVT
jgi:hypothetical protein